MKTFILYASCNKSVIGEEIKSCTTACLTENHGIWTHLCEHSDVTKGLELSDGLSNP